MLLGADSVMRKDSQAWSICWGVMIQTVTSLDSTLTVDFINSLPIIWCLRLASRGAVVAPNTAPEANISTVVSFSKTARQHMRKKQCHPSARSCDLERNLLFRSLQFVSQAKERCEANALQVQWRSLEISYVWVFPQKESHASNPCKFVMLAGFVWMWQKVCMRNTFPA